MRGGPRIHPGVTLSKNLSQKKNFMLDSNGVNSFIPQQNPICYKTDLLDDGTETELQFSKRFYRGVPDETSSLGLGLNHITVHRFI